MRKLNSEYFTMIERCIDSYRENIGVSPSIYDIADATGIPKSTVSRYLNYMKEHDMIEFEGRRNIVTKAAKMNLSATVKVPLLGNVSCGIPRFAEENIEEYVRLPISLFGKGDFFLLRANGDSMIEAGICNGDVVLIRQQNYADPGQIVVALMEDEATLKRYYPESEHKRIRLHPENKTMEDIYVDDCMIQGVAVKVFKDLE